MHWIDSHVHLDFPQFDADRADVIARARKSGMVAAVVPGTEYATWPKLKSITTDNERLFPAYGLHPYFIERHTDAHLDALDSWLSSANPVAVGECGLDYYLPELDRERQRYFFQAQLELASQCDLPIIIHSRKAVDEIIGMIKSSGCRRGVFHSYSGSLQQAQQLMKLGFLMSFGGPVTWPRSRKLRQLIRDLPLDAIMLETDAPDQSPEGCQVKRNEPSYLTTVLSSVAKIKSLDTAQVAEATSRNAVELFGLPDDLLP